VDQDMFIRGISDMNDSRQKNGIKPYAFKALTDAQRVHFQNHYGISETRVKEIFNA